MNVVISKRGCYIINKWTYSSTYPLPSPSSPVTFLFYVLHLLLSHLSPPPPLSPLTSSSSSHPPLSPPPLSPLSLSSTPSHPSLSPPPPLTPPPPPLTPLPPSILHLLLPSHPSLLPSHLSLLHPLPLSSSPPLNYFHYSDKVKVHSYPHAYT